MIVVLKRHRRIRLDVVCHARDVYIAGHLDNHTVVAGGLAQLVAYLRAVDDAVVLTHALTGIFRIVHDGIQEICQHVAILKSPADVVTQHIEIEVGRRLSHAQTAVTEAHVTTIFEDGLPHSIDVDVAQVAPRVAISALQHYHGMRHPIFRQVDGLRHHLTVTACEHENLCREYYDA